MGRVVTSARHIGLNAHLLNLAGTYRSAGINNYILNVLEHLPPGEFKYSVFLSDRLAQERLSHLHLVRSRLPTDKPIVRIAWEQIIQPFVIALQKLDLLHAMAFAGPWALYIPWAVTIYDLTFALFPNSFPRANRLYLDWAVRDATRRANRVIAISECTKRDLVSHFNVAPSKIDVVHCGVDSIFKQLRNPDEIARFRAQRGLPDHYILSVGTLEPRKNHVRLIRSFARAVLKARIAQSLVIVGAKGWDYAQVLETIEQEGISERVHLAGFVSQDELPLWYQAADLFVYPSLYEGFGLPVLEAMASGTPVVSSDASSLPEVISDAGMMVSPLDEQALTDSIVTALEPQVSLDFRSRGLKRSSCFSWDRAANETVQVYRSILNRGALDATA